jgi:predicted PurR-regulated permease PerM
MGLTDLAGPPREEARPEATERAAERVVSFRLRSVLAVMGLAVAVLALIGFVLVAQHALTLIAISLFLALALNPAVLFFERRGLGRGAAVGAVSIVAVLFAVLLGLVLIPPLVSEITKFIDALPSLVNDITKGRGTLGHLADQYHVIARLKKFSSSSSGLSGAADPVLTFATGVIGTVFGALLVGFLTLFMLIEGREWRERLLELCTPSSRPRWQRIGTGVYRAVGGFVTGNLLASLLAGAVALLLLLVAGIPYAVPIALLVALFELIPYVGPALVTVLFAAVGLIKGVPTAIVITGIMLIYHAIEGHTLRPMIYGRALKLSALTVLVAIIVGIEAAGILGAVVAIPVVGAIQVILREVLAEREQAKTSALLPASMGVPDPIADSRPDLGSTPTH